MIVAGEVKRRERSGASSRRDRELPLSVPFLRLLSTGSDRTPRGGLPKQPLVCLPIATRQPFDAPGRCHRTSRSPISPSLLWIRCSTRSRLSCYTPGPLGFGLRREHLRDAFGAFAPVPPSAAPRPLTPMAPRAVSAQRDNKRSDASRAEREHPIVVFLTGLGPRIRSPDGEEADAGR